ncbi:MAG: DUF1552 domain-containing protein [Nannocystaceae bacterium]
MVPDRQRAYGRDVISYKSDGAGGIVPNPGQTSPQAAFMALFQGFVPPDPTDALAAQRELARRKSVLDLVHGDIDRLMPRLSAADKIRMQRHLDEIRDLENRLAAIPPDAGGECMMFADPGADPAIGGNNAGTGGDGFDTNAGYSDEDTRARRFSDLVHMAFVCDLSRSVAMQYTMAQSHMSAFPFTGIPYDQHEVGHSVGTTDAVSQILAWQLDQFAYLVAKLRDTPEGAGSVLDNTAMVLLYEGGHGLDPATGDPNPLALDREHDRHGRGASRRHARGSPHRRRRPAPGQRAQHGDARGRGRRGPRRGRRHRAGAAAPR